MESDINSDYQCNGIFYQKHLRMKMIFWISQNSKHHCTHPLIGLSLSGDQLLCDDGFEACC